VSRGEDSPLPPLPTLDVRGLFAGERAALLALLEELSPAEWAAATICPGWSVKDVALHLLGDDVGRIAGGRDGFANPAFATGLDISTLSGLIAAIDRQNAVWVEGTRRISPRLLSELLELTGRLSEAYFRSLDLERLGMAVDWAGPEPAPVWLDLAREYTERWVHQQHIRDAVARPGLREGRWLGPVLATFARGVPRALAAAAAPDGATVRLIVTGEGGGEWVALREGGGWRLGTAPGLAATATVTLDAESAWRLFTKGIGPGEARQRARLEGDAALAAWVLETVSILA
jgi:uncharacterized protein (TIGR03083 family)